ncbi:MAG: hypothetical protein AAB359_05235, partial [Elusimicrobiota bacterium]
ISGTASDNRQNDDVRIAFQQWDGVNNLWYGFDGTGWDFNQSGAYWISMKTNGVLSPNATWWSYAPAGLDGKFTPGTSGFRYMILSRASDLAGNTQDVYAADVSSVIITMDKAAPSSGITLPVDDLGGALGRYHSSKLGKTATNSRFYGSSQDGAYTQYNAGVSVSQIRLTYLSGGDTYYWDQANLNFSSWTVTQTAAWTGALVGGAGPWTWTFLTDIGWPAGDREYKLEARSMDNSRLSDDTGDGNWENPQTRGTNIKYFIVDDSPPLVLITSPTVDATKALAQIRGTASADIAGHKWTEARISTTGVDGTKYWTGAGWGTDTWIQATPDGPTSWYYTVDVSMLKDDVRYQFEARARDYADNYSAVYSTYSITYDITGPLVTLSYPNDGATYSGVLFSTPMAGTSANNQTAAYTGVSTVAVALSEIDGSGNYLNCFTGSVFSGCAAPLWLPAQGAAANWSFNDPDISFIGDHRYKYEVRSADLAGSYSAVSGAITKFDLDKPTSTVLSPSAEFVNSITVVSGQASDERYGQREYEARLGTYTVRIGIRLIGGNWWNNSDSAFNTTSPVWYETSVNTAPYTLGQATVTWNYNLSAGLQSAINTNKRQDYRFVTYAYDLSMNKEYGPAAGEPGNADIPAQAGRIVQFDNEIPVAVATTPANLSYKNSVPALYGVVTDTGVITTVHVLVKARGTSYNSTWKGTYLNSSADWDDSAGKYANWSTATYNNGAWSLPLPFLTPVNNAKISVWARGADKAGNWQASPSVAQIDANQNPAGSDAYYFTYDENLPLSGVTVPETYAVANATGLIKGTAYDPAIGGEPSGVSELRIRLRRSDNAYWTFNSAWNATSADNFSVTGTLNWTKPLLTSAQEDGYQYDIYTHARDNAMNNASLAYFSTFTFVVDFTTPTSKITFPANNAFIGSAPSITGTADDSVENLKGWSAPRNYEAGISTYNAAVELAMQRLSDGLWWDGAAFTQASRQWKTAAFIGASSGAWTYNLPGGAIADGTTYYAMSRVRDIVSNIEVQYTTNFFTGDVTLPTSKASSPSGEIGSVTQISGTALDAAPGELKTSGVVKISLKQFTGAGSPRCYNNTLNNFTACPGGSYPDSRIWFTTGTLNVNPDPAQPSTWTWNTSAIGWTNNSQYNVIALAIDKGDNEKPPGATEVIDVSFLVKTPQADATIDTPSGPDDRNSKSSDFLNITGSGSNLRAVNSVQIRLKRLKEPASWWYEPTLSWMNTDTYTYVSHSGGSWAQAINGPAAFSVNNASYAVTVTAYNSSNEADPSPAERRIVIDNTNPVGFIIVPNKSYINAMPVISGTATDPDNITQPSLQNIYVRIKNVEDGYYWTGSSFSVNAFNIETSYSPQTIVNWSTATVINPALGDGRRYKVFLLPKDKAGNIEANESSMPSYQVLFDTSPPNAWFGYPGNRQVLRTLAPITGTAFDPIGVYSPQYKSDLDRVELQIYDEQSVKWWEQGSGGFSISGSSFNIVSGTDAWTFSHANLESALGSGKYYVLQVRAVDRAGNSQNGFVDVASSRTFVWDKTPPVSSIIQPLDLGKYRPDNLTGSVALNGAASDPVLPFISDR